MTAGSLKWGVPLATGAFALDQSTKALALAFQDGLSAGIDVLPFFSLVLVRNTGVSFGLLGGGPGQWPLILLTGAITLGLCIWLIRIKEVREAVAIGAIIGAAFGNLTDRLRHGAVTDFLDLHYAGHHWPAFNLADSMIFLAVVFLLLSSIKATRKRDRRVTG